MAIEEPGGDRWRTPTLVGAGQHRRNFLASRGMTGPTLGAPCDLSHGVGVRQGKKVVTTLLRQSGRGEDVLRADQPITRGRLDAGWDRGGEEIKATLKACQERQDRHLRRFEPSQRPSGSCAHTPDLMPRGSRCFGSWSASVTASSETKLDHGSRPGHGAGRSDLPCQILTANLVTIRRRGPCQAPCPTNAAQ